MWRFMWQGPFAAMKLFEHRPAMKLLLQGCQEEELPPQTAKALLAYLLTKRALMDSPDLQEQAQADDMSPELNVDTLW